MSWSNYMYFKDSQIAIEVGKIDTDCAFNSEEISLAFDEFIQYMQNDDKKIEVINYLWEKCFVYEINDAMFSVFLFYFKDNNCEIISEDKLNKLTNIKILNR